jgi:hypothetical protein
MKKMIVVLALAAMTGLNVVYTAPWHAQACSCSRSDGTTKCTGQCCGGTGDVCDCFDIGTDNCKAAALEEELAN